MRTLKRILNRLKEKCGAATIEAVVAFTGFLFVIITILNVANYCRAQMIISNAVDAAARELSQYSYFYNMTGMQKFNNYVNENAGIGAANINDVIDGTNSVYTTLSGALSDTTDYGNQLADKIDNQNLTYQDIQTAVLKLDTNSTNIMSSITTMEAKFSSVERNPLLYMKSLAAVAGGEALDLAKSYVIAAPLAKLFTSVNINSGDTSVQQYLENLGIVGGFDGLNFNTSTIFTASAPDEIHIRCYYKISLCNFVDKSLFEIPICKEAVCRAWLGGDDNPVKVSAQAAVPAPEDDGTRSMPEQADADVSGGEVADGDVSGGECGGVVVIGGDSDDDKDSLVTELEDKDKDIEEKKTVLEELVDEVNSSGGADYETALDIYRWAMECGVDLNDLELTTEDGKIWDENSLRKALADTVNDYNSYNAACAVYFSIPGMSDEEKYEKLVELYNNMDYKTDLYIPDSLKYVKSFNANGTVTYYWPDYMGFQKSSVTPLSRDSADTGLPSEWDRYGSGKGNNFSDYLGEDDKYSWEQRALPYEQNDDAYHHGYMNNDCYFDVIDEMLKPNTTADDINNVLRAHGITNTITPEQYEKAVNDYGKYLNTVATAFDGTVDAPYGLTGTVSPAFGYRGVDGEMASQYTTPFTIETMEQMGIVTYDPPKTTTP